MIELFEHIDQFLKHAHREGTRTTGGIENGDFVDGINEGVDFGYGKLMRLFVVRKEVAEVVI